MRNRSIVDFPRNEAGLVDEFIGTAYDAMYALYINLAELLLVDENAAKAKASQLAARVSELAAALSESNALASQKTAALNAAAAAQSLADAILARDASEMHSIDSLGYLHEVQAQALKVNTDLIEVARLAAETAEIALHASVTPGANLMVRADGAGHIDMAWLPYEVARKQALDDTNVKVTAAQDGIKDLIKSLGLTQEELDNLELDIDGRFLNFAAKNDATRGAALVGWDGEQINVQLDLSKKLANYTALRAYKGSATRVEITNSSQAGVFLLAPLADPGVEDNGTVIVATNGRVWKRQFDASLDVSPKWFGAVGDGATHPLSEIFATIDAAKLLYPHADSLDAERDWAALQAALNSKYSILAGNCKYLCNRPLTSQNKNLSWKGEGMSSEICFTAQVPYGIRIQQNGAYLTEFTNTFVSTTLLNTGTGFSLSYAGYIGEFERNRRLAQVTGVRVSGSDYFQHGWKRCFEFDEVTLLNAKENFAVGRRDLNGVGEAKWWPWTEYGFVFTSTTNLSPTDALFENNDCRYAKTAFYEKGVLEGTRYKDCLAVACKYGIDSDRREVSGDPTVDPWIDVTDCHLNVSAIGVRTNYVYEGWIKDNLIYQFTFFDEEFTGIYTKTGNNMKIMGNHVDGNPASTFASRGIKVQQNNKSVVSFNEIASVDTPIECSGVDGIVGTRFFMNRGQNKAGVEARTVSYTDGASAYQNPSSVPSGIVAEGVNTAAVPIAVDSFATVASFALDAYPVGSVFRLTALCQIMKGSTAGTTKMYLEKTAGAGDVRYMMNSTGFGIQNDSHAPAVNWQANMAAIIKKTVDGPVNIKLAVASGGSNASVAIGDGQYVLERLA